MIDKILLILKAKNLSSSQFADKLGVQRSNISHILSGRNKPSLDFIMKIKSSFPEISTDWLLLGKGEMFVNVSSDKSTSEISDEIPDINLFNNSIEKKTEEKNIEETKIDLEKVINKPKTDHLPKEKQNLNSMLKLTENKAGKKVEMIVFFYNDKTYKEYFPNN